MKLAPVLLWFRQDLRLHDNWALAAAVASGKPVVPVYICDEEGSSGWPLGGASRWWLHHSLNSLDQSLRKLGSRMILVKGRANECLRDLISQTGADSVYWNRCYEPGSMALTNRLKDDLGSNGIELKSFNSALLFEPQEVRNKQGNPFRVFTPFWRHCLTREVASPMTFDVERIRGPESWPKSLEVAGLELLPTVKWDAGFSDYWKPGEENAQARLKLFLNKRISDYAETRDHPQLRGTSMLSPSLHFGEIGPRQIWDGIKKLGEKSGAFPDSNGAKVFLSEVGWREFAYHLLCHFPQTPREPLRTEYAQFPWEADPGGTKLQAWQRGLTGYPIVDAGMRQLWQTGWMHNRVRMIAGSFLVKHLRLPWTDGAAWFWDTLLDADLANNTLGWQWTAGCGADAAPYFRIFAPVTQGRRFDPEGDYIRKWVPELSSMPAKHIHSPWEAPDEVTQAAGVRLGDNYPEPMVDHATARKEALAAWQTIRKPG